jgi:ABC-type phosphate/phosphonate transport system permease subunit
MKNIEKILLVTLVGAIFGSLIGFILPFPYGLIVIFPASIIVGWYGDEIHRFFFRDK